MTNGLFIHCGTKFNRERPFREDRTNEAYAALAQLGEKVGFNVYFSRYPFYDKNSKNLRRAWQYDGEKWKKVRNKIVDIMYYRGLNTKFAKESLLIENSVNLPIINHLELEHVCNDKLLTSNIFPDLMPKTFLINDSYELHRVMNHIPSNYVVIKPRYGSFGKGVSILPKKDVVNGIRKNTVLQEFIDTSEGILGIKSVHDLRTMIVDGKIDHCYLRIPKKGSLISNSSAGGKKIFVDPDDLPQRIKRKIKLIDSHFAHYGPRIYSIDVMQGPNEKIWLLELNSKPGVYYYDGSKRIRKRFYKNAFESMNKLIEQNK